MNIKSLLFFGVASLFSSALVNAQVQTGSPQPTQSGTSSTNLTSPVTGMSQISTSALPDPLRSTLTDNQQYKGWESGQWYFNSSTNQYSVQMPGANPGLTTNSSATVGTSTSSLGTTNTTQGSSTSTTGTPQSLPANPATALPANPTSTPPATGMQLPTSQPIPSVTMPIWYRFDATGKLIPQPKEN